MEILKKEQWDGCDVELRSRPTANYVRDYEKHFLEGSFPLQFPYGRGGINEERRVKASKSECLAHYLNLSIPSMMKGDFVLTVHSMWEKDRALNTALIKCKIPYGTFNVGTAIAQMTEEELNEALKWKNLERRVRSPNYNENAGFAFLDVIEASCKAMQHTNEAAKSARRRMFSLWYTFGPPSLFFTLSPCDETNFRMRVYIRPSEKVSFFCVKEECCCIFFHCKISLHCHVTFLQFSINYLLGCKTHQILNALENGNYEKRTAPTFPELRHLTSKPYPKLQSVTLSDGMKKPTGRQTREVFSVI